MMLTIIDCGSGNIRSLVKILEKVGAEVRVAEDADGVKDAEMIVLPGVGHFATAMKELERRGLVEALREKVVGRGVPFLGVCLGMQLLARRSEEGDVAGLGWVDADCVRFDFSGHEQALKIPNMGWRGIAATDGSPLFPPFDRPWRFYFVHGYHMRGDDPGMVMATADYGGPFTAAVAVGNIVGVQFHPEKSHRFGVAFFENYLRAFSP